MKEFSKRQLIINYLLGICTPAEQKEVEIWLAEDEANVQKLQDVSKDLSSDQLFSSEDKDQIKESIFAPSPSHPSAEEPSPSNVLKLKYSQGRSARRNTFYKQAEFWMKAAAIILIVITASFGAYHYSANHPPKAKTVWKYLSLPYGQTASLQLANGSEIKLKGGSSIRYPSKFAKEKRVVYLQGEAFFSVEHGESWPFVVHTGDITTYDLGTSFDIKAYKNQNNIQVVVAEGKVAVTQDTSSYISALKGNQGLILKKNQWVTFQKDTQTMKRGEGNIRKKIAWKDGILIFGNKPFSKVAVELERWYGIKINIKDKTLAKMKVTGEYDDASLQYVLESIHFILGADYSVKDDVITFQLPKNEASSAK